MNEYALVLAQLRRYNDAQIINLKNKVNAEYDRRFEAEKTNKLIGGIN